MTNITLSLPQELREEMDKFPEVVWSKVVQQAIRRYIDNKTKIPDEEWNRNISLIVSKNPEKYPEVEAIVNLFKILKEKVEK
jgi:metal-responsive CopG/Arc/MetJ family transcriptional regulator